MSKRSKKQIRSNIFGIVLGGYRLSLEPKQLTVIKHGTTEIFPLDSFMSFVDCQASLLGTSLTFNVGTKIKKYHFLTKRDAHQFAADLNLAIAPHISHFISMLVDDFEKNVLFEATNALALMLVHCNDFLNLNFGRNHSNSYVIN